MRILIVEDNEPLAVAIKQRLKEEGYAADYVLDGDLGERRISYHHIDYEVIILDIMLPKKDGFEILKNMRARKIMTPVLVLTARDETDDKIFGLDSGADDYLVKPFSFDELISRVKALMRRPNKCLPQKLEVENLILDPVSRKVHCNNEEIKLTLKEFEILEYFMRNPNQVMGRDQLLDTNWDFAFASFSNVVDVHIKNLRRKLSLYGNGELIETVRGVGYRLNKM